MLSTLFLVTRSGLAMEWNNAETTKDRGFQVVPAAADRIALVIGNANYPANLALANPVHDAEDMKTVLETIKFKVTLVINASQMQMEQAVQQFQKQLGLAKVALFYFSGHGVQYEGQNYLLPIDSIQSISAPGHLRYKSFNIDYLLASMAETRSEVNIVILDACRNNPFPNIFPGSGLPPQGLTHPSRTVPGLFIAYATKANETASDGQGRNSPLVEALKSELPIPGLTISQIFERVQERVRQATGGQQMPATYNELGSVYLVEAQPTTTAPPVYASPLSPPPSLTLAVVPIPPAVVSNCKVLKMSKKNPSWSGPCVKGLAEGYGQVQWYENGRTAERYEGEMKAGKMHGQGTYTWTSGNTYTGDWQNGQRQGCGVFKHADGKCPFSSENGYAGCAPPCGNYWQNDQPVK